MREKKNAVIESARLCIERGGILTAWLTLDYGGAGQGFGGYALALSSDFRRQDPPREGVFCGQFLLRVLQIAGVEEWSALPGRTIRADAEHTKIHGIGHIVKDDWLYPERLAAEVFPKEGR